MVSKLPRGGCADVWKIVRALSAKQLFFGQCRPTTGDVNKWAMRTCSWSCQPSKNGQLHRGWRRTPICAHAIGAGMFVWEHFQSGNLESDSNDVRRACKFTETDVRRALALCTRQVCTRVEIEAMLYLVTQDARA